MFDAATFFGATTTEAGETKVTPVPVGEYPAVISKLAPRPWKSKEDPTKSGVALDVTWEIDDPAVRQFLNRDKVTVVQGLMLDLQDDGKTIDWGKGRNIALNRVRDAVGLNVAGQPFAIPMLQGRVARIRVIHEPYNGEMYAKVGAVTKYG